MNLRSCLGLVMTGWLLCAFQSAHAETWTLKQALDAAISRSPVLESAQKDLSIKKFEYEATRVNSLPVLELKASHGLLGTDPATTPSYSSQLMNTQYISSVSLGLSETLYNNGVNGMKRDVTEQRWRLAEANFNVSRDKLCLEVTDAYYKYSLSEALEDVQQTQLDLLKKQFSTVSTQYSQGVKTRRDFLRFKSEVRRAEIELLRVKSQVIKDRLEVLKSIGLSEEANETLQFRPEPLDLESVKGPVKNIVNRTVDVKNHREAGVARMEEQIAEGDFAVTKRQNGPEITWTANALAGSSNYWQTNQSFSDGRSNTWTTLINFSWKLWDWGAQRNQNNAAAELKQQTYANSRTKILALETQLQTLHQDLNQSYRSYDLSEELLELELKNFEAIETDFRNGRVTYLDLVNSLRDLQNARVKLYTSYFELKGLLARQAYHEGTIFQH